MTCMYPPPPHTHTQVACSSSGPLPALRTWVLKRCLSGASPPFRCVFVRACVHACMIAALLLNYAWIVDCCAKMPIKMPLSTHGRVSLLPPTPPSHPHTFVPSFLRARSLPSPFSRLSFSVSPHPPSLSLPPFLPPSLTPPRSFLLLPLSLPFPPPLSLARAHMAGGI